ncbi:hypothetical protein AUO94_04135 [Planococcus kocurii]|uniref:Uncharacterized protein n=1 Tax=Planococcus kocurii TaxID=1374 RepID=A0ABM5WU99_9BACL|nr:hypothetical protein [Planococcus kocurii]ALS77883.1 hypothetical protein AUO94_04135 [Planococcus kocurii]
MVIDVFFDCVKAIQDPLPRLLDRHIGQADDDVLFFFFLHGRLDPDHLAGEAAHADTVDIVTYKNPSFF